MPTRRPKETTPDLFSALPTVTAAGPSAVPKGKAGPDSLASQQRHFLPKDLAGALKWLDDVEIDALPQVTLLADGLNPRAIILFGSRARGTNLPHSDYDLRV